MSKTTGKIIQIMGVVVDVEFADSALPAIYDALEVTRDQQVLNFKNRLRWLQQTYADTEHVTIDFIDEDNAGGVFLGFGEKVAHPGCTDSYEHFYEF